MITIDRSARSPRFARSGMVKGRPGLRAATNQATISLKSSSLATLTRSRNSSIRDGYIRPVPGAKLEKYDPWSVYRQARERGSDRDPPHQTLLKLVKNMLPKLGSDFAEFTLMPKIETAVLTWCREHGLLGVLPQRARQIVLAPRWEALEPTEGNQAQAELWPVLRTFIPNNVGWMGLRTFEFGAGGAYLKDEPDMVGRLVTNNYIPKRWDHTQIVLRNLLDNELIKEPLHRIWASFFPEVPEGEEETYTNRPRV